MNLNLNNTRKNLNINLYLNTRFTSYSHAAPSPFSLRARVRTSMDATMSCFIDSAVAAYVCACVLFGSFFFPDAGKPIQ